MNADDNAVQLAEKLGIADPSRKFFLLGSSASAERMFASLLGLPTSRWTHAGPANSSSVHRAHKPVVVLLPGWDRVWRVQRILDRVKDREGALIGWLAFRALWQAENVSGQGSPVSGGLTPLENQPTVE